LEWLLSHWLLAFRRRRRDGSFRSKISVGMQAAHAKLRMQEAREHEKQQQQRFIFHELR
jgi:hypothetical protein